MANCKRVLSVVLSILMVLTLVPMSMFGTASAATPAEEPSIDTYATSGSGSGKLEVPIVSLDSTPVFRIANTSNVFLPGTKLVSATDSGLPQISSDYAAKQYAGETPHGYTVVLTSNKELKGNPSLGCSVTGVTITGPTKATSGSGNNYTATYTWTITNGSATFSVGEVKFTAGFTYEYTDSLTGKKVTTQYNAYTSSYAENVTGGAGMVMEYARKQYSIADGTKTWSAFVYRIIGHNTYATYAPGDAEWTRGFFNFNTNGYDTTMGLGMTYHSDKSTDGNVYWSKAVDGDRALAVTYIDRAGMTAAPLSRNNLRFSFYNFDNHGDNEFYVRHLKVISGISSWDADTAHNNTAGSQVGMPEQGQTQINANDEVRYYMTGSGYNDDAETAANGNLVSSYTFLGKAGHWFKKTDRVANVGTAVCLTINSYDKSELRAFVQELLSSNQYEPTSPDPTSGIGINPQGSQNTNWYKAGFSSYLTALNEAQRIIAKPDTNQNEIDLAYNNLNTAVNGLQVRNADTTQLDLAVDSFRSKDATMYDDIAWNAVVDAYEAAQATRNYSIFYQLAVDKATADLNDAIADLENHYADADWSEVDDLIEGYVNLADEAFTDSGVFKYTQTSWNVLRTAVNTAETEKATGNYTVLQQALVDSYAQSIANAMTNLEPSLADYNAYDAQVTRYTTIVLPEKASIESSLAAAGIDLAAYGISNIYETNSWRRIQANLNIDRDYKWYDQETVDDFTEALERAINNRTLVDAIYVGVDSAVEEAMAERQEWYTPASWANLVEALGNVVEGYKIDKQPQVNAMEQAIRDAIRGLEDAEANYSEFEILAGQVEDIDSSIYTEESYDAVIAAVDNIYNNHYNHTAKEQAILNAEVAKIVVAINNLEPLPADYTAVNKAQTRWNNFPDKDKYTAASVAEVGRLIGEVNWNLDITKQAQVDSMAAAINSAIDNLVPKTANYTALKTAYQAAKDKVAQQNAFAASNGGKKYFTDATYSALTTAMAAVPSDVNGNVLENKDIFHQSEVDAMVTALNAAVGALELNGADFTRLEEALSMVPAEEDLEDDRIYVPETVIALNIAVIEATVINESRDDYTIENQAEIDAAAQAVIDAINGLEYQDAYYDDLEAELLLVPTDLSIYKASGVNALNAALSAIPRDGEGNLIKDKKYPDQAIVDMWTLNLHTAIQGLEPDMADYTIVETAKSLANAETSKGIYTEESVAAVVTAINAVEYGYYAKDQAAVDNMAANIDTARLNLKEKPLSTTEYQTVVAKIPADTSVYTEASVAAVNSAKSAADTFLAINNVITKQAEFDALVNALDAAISALEYNKADYSLVKQYIAEAGAIVRANYVDMSAVDAAVAAVPVDGQGNVVEEKTVNEQADVDAMAAAIRNAIDALQEKPLDLDRYQTAIDSVPADLELRTEETVNAMNTAKDNCDAFIAENNYITKQAQFNILVAAYETAIGRLAYKPADYTALNALVDSIDELDPDDYENFDDIYWTYISDFINVTINDNNDLDIRYQAQVDAMQAELQSYIDMLIGLPADWSEVNAAVTDANTEINKGIYTDESVAALQAVIDSIDWTLDRTSQSVIDAYVPAIRNAIDPGLQLKDADYTNLIALIQLVNDLYDNGGVAEDGTEYVNFDDIYWTYMYDFLETVEECYGLKADQQSVVDEYTSTLQSYVDMLSDGQNEENFAFVGTADCKEVDGVKYAFGFKTLMTKTQLNNFVECEGVSVQVEFAQGTRYIGTGSVIKVVSDKTGEVIDEYVVVIYGDVDGNAKIDSSDALAIKLALSGLGDVLAGAAKQAANVYGSRPTINNQDADALSDVARNVLTIDQVTGKVADAE